MLSSELIEPGHYAAWDVLSSFKKRLPYLLRFQRVTRKFKSVADHEAERELRQTTLTVPREDMTATELLLEIAKRLPAGWQATEFPGRLILYKEQTEHRRGRRIWPR